MPVGKTIAAASSGSNIFMRIGQQYLGLKRWIAAICALIGFLFLISVYSGLDDIWFHWPALPSVLIVVPWAVLRRRES